jgi:hypothetical protein
MSWKNHFTCRPDHWTHMTKYESHVMSYLSIFPVCLCHATFNTITQGSQTQNDCRAIPEKKMLRWPQFNKKKLIQAANYYKTSKNNLNLIKFDQILSVYKMFVGRSNASRGPRVWDPCYNVSVVFSLFVIPYYY